ncbi:hypothetical protein PN498_10840 [Oscillatoria sp. CS-180]|uniref:hypothetical protein n=1 Tax=Oscillatoria sp. CS-180 TaxID=3021720 RepID=UPI00232BE365|nr:hypothetical protein [Oscillatoria sp. CS-180]MDB9526486.1 hypothetical protein [Oscillatoria sp. CS-180]
MKLNQTAKVLLSTALVSTACMGFIATAATSAQARDVEERPRQVVIAQRVERSPAPPELAPEPAPPEPAPRAPVRLPDNPQDNRPEPADVSLDIEIQI